MPLYDFKCDKCGNLTERLVKTNKEEVWCPKCDSLMHLQLPLSSFQLKGSGWYKTDFKNNK